MIVATPRVVFFHRKPYPTGHFSLENLFADVRRRLAPFIDAQVAESRFFSRGVLPRVFNMIEAALRQGDVNIVTGDINYVSLFLRGEKTILVVHDCGFTHKSAGLSRLLQKWIWLTIPVMRVARVVAVSDFTRGEILRLSGCAPGKVVVIPNPVGSRYIQTPRAFRRARPTLLQIGQSRSKNLTRVIHAIRGLAVRLVTVGELSRDDRDALVKHRIDHVNHPRLSDEQVIQTLSDSDILIFPSTYEGFGLPIVEAQAVGRAVITSNVSPMPWVAGDAACFVDPFSVESIRAGIQRVIADDEYREGLVAKGLENVKRFHGEATARLYLNEIRAIVAA